MSFINLQGLQEVKELRNAPEGRYLLRVTSAKMHVTDNGVSIQTILEIEASQKYANVFHYVALPNGQDAGKDQTKLLMAKRFFTQFNIPIDGDGVEIEQFVGCSAEANLGVEEYQGQSKNVLRMDRLPTEA